MSGEIKTKDQCEHRFVRLVFPAIMVAGQHTLRVTDARVTCASCGSDVSAPRPVVETSKEPWWHRANRGIIGLGPEPFDEDSWPTEGYDGELRGYAPDKTVFAGTMVTRDEWLALADEMIARWTAWRAHVAALPERV